MKLLDHSSTLQLLAKTLKKPCMYLHFPELDYKAGLGFTDILAAVPYMSKGNHTHGQAVVDGSAFVVCDTEEEMHKLYDLTYGDDGAHVNKYSGPVRVYALTCNSKGQLQNENT